MTDNFDQEILQFFIEEARELLEEWESGCLAIEQQASPDTIDSIFRIAHNIKGSAKAVGLVPFSEFVHKVEDTLELVRLGKRPADADLAALLLDCQEVFLDWMGKLQADPKMVYDSSTMEQRLKAFAEAKASPIAEIPPAETKSETPTKASKSADSIRISVDKLDRLFRIVGELSIQNEILFQAWESGRVDSEIASNSVELLNKGFGHLRDQTLSLRLQPVASLFQKLERAAKDVARKVGKKVVIERVGETEELDKNVMDRMSDPLTHIIRNAVDHGVEDPAQRKESGKPEGATVKIAASAKPNGVLLSIQDDGKGLDREKILEKAIAKGLADPQQTADDQTFKLLFAPGFSTAEKVTEFSGRGVGLDVVNRTVEDLGGSIDIASELGKGTTFDVLLPSSLSILDAIIVSIDRIQYAVPIPEVSEILNLDDFAIEGDAECSRMFSLRGQVIPIQKLGDFLPRAEESNLQASTGTINRVSSIALLAKDDRNRAVAFEIDDVQGQQSVVVRDVDRRIQSNIAISGGTILANGEPGLILDLNAVTRHYLQNAKGQHECA